MAESPEVEVRPTTPGDAEAWLDLLEEVAAEGLWLGTEAPIDREARRSRFVAQLGSPSTGSFVAVDGDQLVGSLGAVMRAGMGAGVADLGMLVASGRRGQGVGSALMEACLAWAREVGAHKLALTVWPHNHAARALYAKFGFVTEGTLRREVRRRNGELWDAIVMGLVLDTASPGRQAGTRPAGAGRGGGARAATGGERPRLELPGGALRRDGVLLRPGRLADAEALAAAIDDPEVHRWLDAVPDPYTVEDARRFLAGTRQGWVEGTAANFLVLEEEGARLAGGIGLTLDREDPGLGEVGYWLAARSRGRGLATTAVEAVARWALGPVGLRRLELRAALGNRASRAVAERAAFRPEGVLRSWRAVHGRPTDFALYSRLAAPAPGPSSGPCPAPGPGP